MARCNRPGTHGFAYLWLLIAIALMGLGAAMAIEVQQTLGQRNRERELLAIGQQFRQALTSYQQAGAGGRPSTGAPSSTSVSGSSTFSALASPADLARYPESLDDLLKDSRFPGIRRHLRKVFVDPMTGKPEWGYVRMSGRITGIHSLSQEAPIKQTGFELQGQDFSGAQRYAEWIFTAQVLPPPTASAAKP